MKSLSRFARNSKDCIQAVRELQSLGISVFFEKEHLDTGKLHNEMTLSMMSAFAQEESISISQNMRRGALMRMKNGTFRISQVPYGYRRKESGELIPIPEEAEVVRWIYHSFLSGKGIASIAKDLNPGKFPNCVGNRCGVNTAFSTFSQMSGTLATSCSAKVTGQTPFLSESGQPG